MWDSRSRNGQLFYRPLDGADIHRRRSFIAADRNKTENKGACSQDNAVVAIEMKGTTATVAAVKAAGVASTSLWKVTRAATGGQSSKIDEHDKSSGGDTGLNEST